MYMCSHVLVFHFNHSGGQEHTVIEIFLYAAVNTNNGTEALNKVLKYNYLPHNKNMTLSAAVTLNSREVFS